MRTRTERALAATFLAATLTTLPLGSADLVGSVRIGGTALAAGIMGSPMGTPIMPPPSPVPVAPAPAPAAPASVAPVMPAPVAPPAAPAGAAATPAAAPAATAATPPSSSLQASPEFALKALRLELFFAESYEYFQTSMLAHKKELGLNDKEVKDWLKMGSRIYRGKNLLRIFSETYVKRLPKSSAESIAKWAGSPRMGHLTTGLVKAFEFSPKARADFYKDQAGTSLKQNHRNALVSYLRAFEIERQYATIQGWIQYGIELAANSRRDPAERDSRPKIRARVADNKAAFVDKGLNWGVALGFIGFKGVRDDDIDFATRFASSTDGQAYVNTALKALDVAFEAAATTFADQIEKNGKASN